MSQDNTPSDGTLTPDELLQLRKRLDAIDDGIVDLIAERQAVVTTIGDHKLKTGAPLRHYAREREVIERGMERARSRDVSPLLARDILETLIHHSLGNQETHKLEKLDYGRGLTALVIGGLGRMGEWMCHFLDTVGYDVVAADRETGPSRFRIVTDWESIVDDFDLVVVAVPLRPSNQILHQLAEIRPRGLVFDIGSLKSPMQSGLQALVDVGCRVCSVHPMFGPNEIGLSGRHIIFCDVGNEDAVQEARTLFEQTAAECVNLSLEEHDEVMAWVLGLSHLVNIAFASTLAESGEAVPLLQQISSSTFNSQLAVAAQVVSENPALYYEIQQGNRMTVGVVEQFQAALEGLLGAIRNQDETFWTEAMTRANERISVSKGAEIGQTD